MLAFLTVLIAIVCLLLMAVVLIQNPKGGGLDSTFGGSAGANQMLGAAKTTDLIEKLTWGLGTALLVLCLITSLVVGTGGSASSGTKTEGSNMEMERITPVDAPATYQYEG